MRVEKRKVVVVEGLEIVREAISETLSKHCDVDVVAQVSDGYSALRACRQHTPSMVLLDLDLPASSGPDTLNRLRESFPKCSIIVTSGVDSTQIAYMALSSGASAYITKSAGLNDYVNAIRAAKGGYAFFPRQYIDCFIKSSSNISKTGNMFGLSARELEIISACVKGYTTKQVAANLNLSVRTIETHRHSAYKKTGCTSIKQISSLLTAL